MTISANIIIRRAESADIALVAPLFHAYRRFYQRADEGQQAQDFIAARLVQQDTVLFLALDASGQALGFTQLFPTFSSVSAKTAWILNDLFVSPAARKNGVARQLMQHAVEFCRTGGAAWVSLQTARDNLAAQALYRSLGFTADEKYLNFQYVF